jgi:predicted DNA repair protein MutK
MAGGLLALLDDVAAIAKVAASSLDDIATTAAKAGTKAAGIVIDDTAVTPNYVVGFAAERELPIIWKIAVGSLKNKLLFLLPGALLLSAIAPWAITPLLIVGGFYLCFEGIEKVLHWIMPHHGEDATANTAQDVQQPLSAQQIEDDKVTGAIRTDFILSAEIMAITLASIASPSFAMKAIILGVVGIGITALVYGAVALIVKADDVGMVMVRRGGGVAAIGRAIVSGMPKVLALLSVVGTAAMLWVGGGIIIHGLAEFNYAGLEHGIHDAGVAVSALSPYAKGFVAWLTGAALSGVFGLVAGAATIPLVNYVLAPVMAGLRKSNAS